MKKDKDSISFDYPRIISPKVFSDNRGWFYEAYNQKSLEVLVNFIQDNHSYSEFKGTVRGIHFQKPPFEQAKLIRVLKGKIFDVVVDLRPKSKTFLKVITFELDSDKKDSLLIPKGFAHGFMTLVKHTEVYYKVDEEYSKNHEVTIFFDDPTLNIPWPKIDEVVLSQKDSKGLALIEALNILEEN